MRLLDADNIKGYAKYIKTNENFEPYIMIVDLAKLLDEQPTAYDIDAVVSELRRRSGNGYRDIDGDYVPPMIKAEKAIEIVKQGCVSDDVCEYENTDDEYCKWKINSVFPETINNPHVAERENISTAKYCPCCGKKIKVVK